MRTIIINGLPWKYRIGRSTIVARSNGRKLLISIADIFGVAPDDVERARWKRTNNCNVTPKHIADWIRGIYDPAQPR